MGNLLDLNALAPALRSAPAVAVSGRVVKVSGLIVEATMPSVSVGATVEIDVSEPGGPRDVIVGECVGFSGDRALLVPAGDLRGVKNGAAVTPLARAAEIAVGPELLGRVVDWRMRPIDGGAAVRLPPTRTPLSRAAPNAMSRRRVARAFATGVRTIDTLLTCGEGQRVAIMAGAGVGKSVLMGMLAKHCEADVIVVGLIGERGREVREFIERDLGPKGRARAVVVVATGDTPPLERVHAANAATAVAEHFRASGKKVLLLMDSLTRVAMALREIGLSADEPPTSKGYPPSVFAAIPKLLERAGNDEGAGSITALYTVLVEGDDLADPVADCARAALDGHIVLSRKLAGAGHFPAIDVLQSVSRVALDITPPAHQRVMRDARDVLSALAESADLVDIGAYVAGSNARVDHALAVRDALRGFVRQEPDDKTDPNVALTQLQQALKAPAPRAGKREVAHG
jgi:flagellum-specific ATP synthase